MGISCFSFTSTRDTFYRYSFENAGLRSTTVDIQQEGKTVMHCWAPKKPINTRPNLVLLHGLGANAMWQWDYFISPLTRRFNVYVPDLLFFGESYTTRADRSEEFQARSVMGMMEVFGVKTMRVAGISYGGFVGYSMAAQYRGVVEKVVLVCSGVSVEEKDMENGMFKVSNVDEAVDILLPKTPDKLRELIRFTFYRPTTRVPSCFLSDFIQVMCTEYRQERKELIETLYKDRKLANLPKINQPTLLIWGEHDQVFPMELAHRLLRHLGDNAQLAVVKKAGHALNMEKPKDLAKCLNSFLDHSHPKPSTTTTNGHLVNSKNNK